jgi:hypothetical protein
VNLLTAWAEQRVELEANVGKKFVLFVTILLVGILALPFLATQRSKIAEVSAKSTAKLQRDETRKNNLDIQAKLAAPSIQMDEMIARCHKYSNSYLDELTKIINNAPTEMYFEQFQTEVSNGECSIKVLAHASSSDVGRNFVDLASKGSNVISAIQTSVRQGQLSESSVKFDFIKKVKL